MNEELIIKLNVEGKKKPEIRGLYTRVGKLLSAYGLKPDKTEGKYRMVQAEDCAYKLYCAKKALREADWLKGLLGNVRLVRKEKNELLAAVTVPEELKVDPDTYKCYEALYLKEKKLPYPFVVDETNVLLAEPELFKLAKEIGVLSEGDVMIVPAGKKVEKQVLTRTVHLSFEAHKYTLKKNDKIYVFSYPLSVPIFPGDILKGQTKYSFDYVCVDSVRYTFDEEEVGQRNPILKNSGLKLEQKLDDTTFEAYYTEKRERREKARNQQGGQKKRPAAKKTAAPGKSEAVTE